MLREGASRRVTRQTARPIPSLIDYVQFLLGWIIKRQELTDYDHSYGLRCPSIK